MTLLVLGVLGLDIRLTAIDQVQSAVGEPAEERGGVVDLVSGELVSGRVMGLRSGAGSEPGQGVPDGEPAGDLRVVGLVGDAQEVLDKSALEHADLLIDGGQQAAGHEQVSQVYGRRRLTQQEEPFETILTQIGASETQPGPADSG